MRYKPLGRAEIFAFPPFVMVWRMSSRPKRSVMLRFRVDTSVGVFKEIEVVAGLGNISKGRVCGVVVGEDKGESFTTQKSS